MLVDFSNIFIYAGIGVEFPCIFASLNSCSYVSMIKSDIAGVFDGLSPTGVKAAVHLVGTSRYEQEFNRCERLANVNGGIGRINLNIFQYGNDRRLLVDISALRPII